MCVAFLIMDILGTSWVFLLSPAHASSRDPPWHRWNYVSCDPNNNQFCRDWKWLRTYTKHWSCDFGWWPEYGNRMFWGSVPEDFAQQANVNGSHSAILSALREHVLRSLRPRWDHVCNERSNPDRRSLQYFKRSHIAEVVFITIWSGMCVITFVGCWVPSLQCIGFEPCKMVFKASNWFKNLSFSPKYLTIPKGNSPLEPSWLMVFNLLCFSIWWMLLAYLYTLSHFLSTGPCSSSYPLFLS